MANELRRVSGLNVRRRFFMEELGKYFFLNSGACKAVYREIESDADKEFESKLTAGPWADLANKCHKRRD